MSIKSFHPGTAAAGRARHARDGAGRARRRDHRRVARAHLKASQAAKDAGEAQAAHKVSGKAVARPALDVPHPSCSSSTAWRTRRSPIFVDGRYGRNVTRGDKAGDWQVAIGDDFVDVRRKRSGAACCCPTRSAPRPWRRSRPRIVRRVTGVAGVVLCVLAERLRAALLRLGRRPARCRGPASLPTCASRRSRRSAGRAGPRHQPLVVLSTAVVLGDEAVIWCCSNDTTFLRTQGLIWPTADPGQRQASPDLEGIYVGTTEEILLDAVHAVRSRAMMTTGTTSAPHRCPSKFRSDHRCAIDGALTFTSNFATNVAYGWRMRIHG